MAITISGENNNDKILASDGVIDQISGFSIVGVVTATSFTGDLTGNVTGNLTGNVNSTSPLLLQTGGSERFRITGNNELGIAGANYGSSGQVLTSGGSGSAVSWTTIPAQITFSNPSNNRILTSEGGIGVNAESKLTFDTTTTQLKITRDDDSNSGLYVFHNDGNECARLVQKGTGHEGTLVLRDGGTATVLLDAETGSNSYINSGKVGINTTTPGRQMHIFSGSSGHPLVLERGDNSNTQIEVRSGGAIRGLWGASSTANFMVYDNDASDIQFSVFQTGNFGFGGVTPGGTPANKNVFLAIGDSDTGIVQDGDGQLEIFANAVEVVNFNAIDGYTSTKNITTTGTITSGSELKVTGAEPRLTFTDTDNNPDFQIWANAQKFSIYDSTNSATRINIDSSGRVSVGRNLAGYLAADMSSAANDFIVTANAGSNGGMSIVNSGSNDIGNIFFANGTGENAIGRIQYEHQNNAMVFQANNDERLRIASNGKIGINNNNPQFPLHITNTSSTFNSAALIKGDNSTSGQGAYATFTNTTDSKSAYFGIDGNGLFAIDPGAALVGTSGSEPIIFATNGNAERVRINASTTATVLVQQASGADVFYVNTDTAETRNSNSLTHINYGLAIGKSRTQNGTGYGTAAVWTPYYHGEGEKVFGIDPSWSLPELRRFFGTDSVEWYAEEDAPGGYCIKVTGACNVGSNYNSGFPYLPIDDDDQFFQEMWIRTDAGNSVNHYGGSIQLDKNFANPTGNPGSFGYELMINHTTNDATWRRRTATLGPNHGTSMGSFRNNHTGGKRKYCTPQLLLNYQHNSGSRVCYISGWAWYRRRSRGNTYFGSISKGSGSFQIKHPLEAKKDTHYLRHSFIEGPKCDNIYRGKATLSSGTATVNLDTEGTMTEGTFVALNDNVQCYTTNETGWSAVKGTVSGNILTITAQDNTSTDTISWMVVGERKDDEIKASDLTDSSGKLLVEPQVDQEYVGVSTTPMVAPGMES